MNSKYQTPPPIQTLIILLSHCVRVICVLFCYIFNAKLCNNLDEEEENDCFTLKLELLFYEKTDVSPLLMSKA